MNGLAEMALSRGDLSWPSESGAADVVWRFRGSHGDRGLEGHVGALPTAFVGLDYPNPDGSHATCLNSKIASLEVRVLSKRGVWRLDRTLTARGLAALEIGLRGDTHGIAIRA